MNEFEGGLDVVLRVLVFKLNEFFFFLGDEMIIELYGRVED